MGALPCTYLKDFPPLCQETVLRFSVLEWLKMDIFGEHRGDRWCTVRINRIYTVIKPEDDPDQGWQKKDDQHQQRCPLAPPRLFLKLARFIDLLLFNINFFLHGSILRHL